MNIEEVAFADAKIESVSSCLQYCDVVLLDWREVRWRIRFDNVLSVENLNIEGEEIDRLEIKSEDEYVARVRSLVDEPDAEVKAYNFFIPWKNEPRLRVVAASCDAEEIGRDSTAVTNDVSEGER